ncbi:CCA tRNA nucleotidyltransferase [Loigolactobacillus backii]|uniref:CCA tRNA nucleotidyltransferase n=1 Tax=Loigolactobacillus backii TaxID=375175 RepID=UPI000C1CB6F1|nr:CCA tRNA nucleotidyltransferase [Loigolactobacillus backii]PIO83376.1 CCA tRNA nucleotidyltransferase [Loigolactobacillus backii]
MKLSTIPEEFTEAIPIIQAIEQAGYAAYFVGGSVRDAILGNKKIHDVDIATSAYPAEVKAIFRRTIDTGIQHGTVTVMEKDNAYEVTTFRTESTYQDFRRPDHVTFVRSLDEDLKRRDFTINALALRHDGTIIDLFDGLTDLKHGLIRAVGIPEERFHEDALRMMRAVRFQSQLNFELEPLTEAAIAKEHGLLAKIAVERIHEEFVKLLLGQNRAAGLKTFVETDLYQKCPGFRSAGANLLRIADLPDQRLVREKSVWLLIAYELGLDTTATRHLLRQWKSSNELVNNVGNNVTLLAKFLADHITNWDLYAAGLDNLLSVNEVATLLGAGQTSATLMTAYSSLAIHDKHELAVNGANLIQQAGVKPGPLLGDILAKLEQQVVENQLANDEASLLAAAKELLD